MRVPLGLDPGDELDTLVALATSNFLASTRLSKFFNLKRDPRGDWGNVGSLDHDAVPLLVSVLPLPHSAGGNNHNYNGTAPGSPSTRAAQISKGASGIPARRVGGHVQEGALGASTSMSAHQPTRPKVEPARSGSTMRFTPMHYLAKWDLLYW